MNINENMENVETNETPQLLTGQTVVIHENANAQLKKKNETYKDDKSKNSCLSKFKEKFGKGSTSISIFNVCILIIGTGVLALPQKAGIMGIAIIPIVIIIGGLANIWSLLLLSYISDRYKIYNYPQLAIKTIHKKIGIFIDVVLILNTFGLMVVYQASIYKLLGGVVNDIGKYGYENLDKFIEEGFWKEYKWKFGINCGIFVLILFPLSLVDKIEKLRYGATFAIFSLFIMFLIVIIESPWFIKNYYNNIYSKDDKSTHMNIYDITVGFNKKMDFLTTFGTLFFAYVSQMGIFPLVNSVKDKSKKNIDTIFNISMIISITVFILIAIIGYLTQPINTPDLIIERTNIFKSDWIMIVGRILFICALIVKLVVNHNSCRYSIINLAGKDPENFSVKLNVIISIPVLAVITLIVSLYQGIDEYISLVGSFCAVILGFTIPGLMYVLGNEYPKYHWKNVLSFILLVVLSLIGLVSGIFDIKNMIEG